MTLSLHQDISVSIKDVLNVAEGTTKVVLATSTRQMLDARRGEIERFVEENSAEQIYGFNRGFGHNAILKVASQDMKDLQVNLIRSHACGVGEPAPVPVVRAMMFLRAVSLARGHSGVRALVVQRLLDFLNAQITPVIPCLGSVSASGDLAPLSHMALGLIGEGDVIRSADEKHQRVVARAAMRQAGIEPLQLEMKEGLALNNGAQFANALGIVGVGRMDALIKTATLATALSAQAMLGADTPFRADLHTLRRHKGSQKVARWIFALMKDSPLRNAHRPYEVDGEIQDPYSLRCAAQILGPCLDLIERAKETFVNEANSVTDNPVILAAGRGWSKGRKKSYDGEYVDVVSGGHFHGMPVAVDLFGLLQAMAIMARLSNMRCARYIDRGRNKGLGGDMKWPGVTDNRHDRQLQSQSSALMIPEYVTAGLTNAIWAACMPSHLFSLSTSAGQEDHVSMASNVGLRVIEQAPRLAEVLAIELAFASQAAAIRHKMHRIPTLLEKDGWIDLDEDACRLSPVCESILTEIRRYFPIVETDRAMADNIRALGEAVLDGRFVQVAERDGHQLA